MHYLLVHGSWHGKWCWEKLLPYLAPHNITTFDLPGSGSRFSEIDGIDFSILVNAVEEQLLSLPTPITIIAHSFAGLLVAPLAEKYASRIEKIIYLAAWLPKEGLSLVDMAIAYNNSQLPSIFVKSENPLYTCIDPEGAKTIFYHDCSPADQIFASQRIKPKNKLPDHTPQQAVNPQLSLQKSIYLLCTEDRVVHPHSQRDIAKSFGFDSAQIIEFNAGHSPFLSNPEGLAKIIISASPLRLEQ